MVKDFDVVTITAVSVSRPQTMPEWREPRVGDRAVVVEVLSNPPGYYLEGFSAAGETIWVEPFAEGEVSFEVVGNMADGHTGAA